MLRKANVFREFTLHARDGDIGTTKEFCFDDQNWMVRYLVADTAGWLENRRILISPYALDLASDALRVLPVDLTKKQIERSPVLAPGLSVSRAFEVEYYGYYCWPVYWAGSLAWGHADSPAGQHGDCAEHARQPAPPQDTAEPCLRSTREVTGYHIEAQNGEIGHVEDFMIDDQTWAIRYLIVNTCNGWNGKQVLISTEWIEPFNWGVAKVQVNLRCETIKDSPLYAGESQLTRDYEIGLYRYYDRQGYWAAAHGRRS